MNEPLFEKTFEEVEEDSQNNEGNLTIGELKNLIKDLPDDALITAYENWGDFMYFSKINYYKKCKKLEVEFIDSRSL